MSSETDKGSSVRTRRRRGSFGIRGEGAEVASPAVAQPVEPVEPAVTASTEDVAAKRGTGGRSGVSTPPARKPKAGARSKSGGKSGTSGTAGVSTPPAVGEDADEGGAGSTSAITVTSWPDVEVDFRVTSGVKGRQTTRIATSLQAAMAVAGNLIPSLSGLSSTHLRDRGFRGGRLGTSGTAEVLLRLGLKHIDDPELWLLIPSKRADRGEVRLPDPLPPTGEGKVPPVQYATDVDGDEAKITVIADEALLEAVDAAAMGWLMTHPEYLLARVSMPGAAAWMQAVLRLGIKHLGDPDVADLVPLSAAGG